MGTFSDRLRYAITNYALGATSYKSFASLVDIPYRTLQNYLNGERSPNIEALEKFHKNGINVNWLISGEGTPYLSNEIDRDLLDKVFLIFSNEVLEYAFGAQSLLDKRERYRLLSFIMSNNYLGIGTIIHEIVSQEEGLSLKEMEEDLAAGLFRGIFDKVSNTKAELWKALEYAKSSRSGKIPPFPLD